MGFDPSYVSHVEARRHRPTEDFARRAEAVLAAGGAIWQRFQEYDDLRHARRPARRHRGATRRYPSSGCRRAPGCSSSGSSPRSPTSDGDYRCVVRRELYNAGTEPVTRYLVRISVDRYPGRPGALQPALPRPPADLGRARPGRVLRCPRDPEPMHWRPKHDRDAFKEIWLLFENDDARFPLYPGQRATIEYAYTVGEDKWGPLVPARRPPADPPARRPAGLPAGLDPRSGASRPR